MLWMLQEEAGRDVGPIRVPYRDHDVFLQSVFATRPLDKPGEFVGASFHILEVEHALGEPAEEPRHPILKDVTSKAQDRGAWKQFPPQRNQIALVPACSMKQQKHRRTFIA